MKRYEFKTTYVWDGGCSDFKTVVVAHSLAIATRLGLETFNKKHRPDYCEIVELHVVIIEN